MAMEQNIRREIEKVARQVAAEEAEKAAREETLALAKLLVSLDIAPREIITALQRR
jgi:hypothetical protein